MTDPDAFAALASLLEAGRECTVPVRGTSMFPFLQQGDRLHLCQIVPENLRLGDLIAFRREERLIVHRFAGRVTRDSGVWLRQKGDNLSGHSLIPIKDLVGRVAWVETPTTTRDMLSGAERRRNLFLGFRALILCLAREGISGTARSLGLRRRAAP